MKIITYLKKLISALVSFPSRLLPSRWIRKMNADQRQFFNLIVTGVVLVVGTWTITSLLSPDKSDAAWWNDSWLYRQEMTITIPSNNSDLSNIETLITLDTQSLISNGKLQSSCQDIRFTSNTGKVLPYYIDSGCNTNATKIWILVDTIPANTTAYSLLLYYGNSSATAGSDQNTFKLLRGVVGYWTSNDTSGATLSDSSPQANNGTLDIGATGTQTTTTQAWTNGASGKYASSINLDGTDDKVTISTAAAQLTTGMTISTWIKPTAGGSTQNIVDNSNAWSYRFYRNGTSLTLQLSTNGTNNGYHTASNALTAGVWQHIVAVFNGSNVILYVNGTQILSEAAGTATIQSPSAGWILGSYGTGEYYNGSIDDTRIYNRALTTSEITDLYQNPGTIASIAPGITRPTVTFGSEEKSEGPVLYLSFNEGSGTTANDSSSNNNDGTISGATWKNDSNCLSGKCLSFDGTDDYVSIADNSSVDLAESWTIGGWFKPSETAIAGSDGSGTPRQMLISKWYSSASTLINYSLDISGTGKLRASVADGSTSKSVSSTTILSPNTWYHLQATFDGDTGDLKVFINGTLEGTNATGFTSANTNIGNIRLGQFDFGWSAYRDEYRGLMDDVKIYPYVRTQEQTYQDFNSGAAYVLGARASNLSEGLVGYWRLDEASGNTLADSSGNNHTATASDLDTGNADTNTPPTVTTGKYGNARNFDGTDDSVDVAHNAGLNVGTTYTVSAWIKPETMTADQHILGMNSGPQFNFKISSTGHIHAVAYRSQSGSWPSYDLYGTNGKVVTGQWQHITMTVSGTNIKVFYNGQLDKEGTIASVDTTAGTSGIKVGQSGMSWSRGWFDGSIGDVRLYNRTLSPSEVTQLYNSAPPPVTYYDFEEKSGTTAYDKSGNGNTGTLNSNPLWSQGKYGGGLHFDTAGDYVSTSGIVVGTTWTISTWAKFPLANNGTYRTLARTGSSLHHVLVEPGGLLGTWNSSFGSSGFDVDTLSAGWHHISAVGDGGTTTFYVNGTRVGTSAQQLTGNITQIGGIPGTQNWGNLDEIRIYNYARTPGQIIEDMNAGHPIGGSPVGSQVGYWKLDEGTGTTANNSGNAGSAINGTLLNSPTWSSGKAGKALTFDGTDDYVNMGNPTSLQITSDLSISAWVKTTETNLGGIVSKFYNTGTNRAYRLHINNGTAGFLLSGDGAAYSTLNYAGSFNSGEWVHIVATYNASSGTAKIYKNGILGATSTSFPTSIHNPAINFNIGTTDAGTTGANTFEGQIDEVKVYNTTLTDEEVRLDYNSGQSNQFGVLGTEADGTPSNSNDRMYCPPGDTTASCGPVGEWKFDDKYGTTPKDTSGSGYNGTFVGTPTWVQGKVGSALDFSGSGQYVTMGDNLDLIGSPLTISVWVKPRNHIAYGGIVSKLATGGNYRLVMNDTSGKLSFGIRASDNTFQAMASTSTLPLNEWSHIVVTYDNATTAKMYINGKLDVQSSAFTVSRGDATTAFAVGYNSNNAAYFDGAIDHVQLYNYVRSEAQISWDYSRGAPIAHYKLNECQGSTVHSSILPYNSLLNGTINVGASGTQTNIGTCQTAGTAWGNGASGKFGSSLNFDGTNDYVDIGDPASGVLDITGDLTVSAWVRPSNLTGIRFILSKLYLGEFELGTNNDGLIWRHGNGSTYSGPQWNSFFSEGTDTWYHVVVVRTTSNTTLSVYKNGQSFGTPQTYSVTPTASTNSLYIGSRSGGSFYFNGQIDDVQIYNYALTQQQIKDVMNQGAIRFGP